MKSKHLVLIFGAFLLFYIVYGYSSLAFTSMLITSFSIYNFIDEIGKTVAIRSLMILIASIQWILGPYLSYSYLSPFDYYHMPVPQDDYFALAIPGTLLFAIGLYFIQDKYIDGSSLIIQLKSYIESKYRAGLYLIFLGFTCTYLGPFFPSSLAFFFYLLANVKYVGAFYILFSNRSEKYIYLTAVILFLVLDAFAAAMFHDLLLWLSFTFLLLALNIRFSFYTKLALLCAGGLLIFGLQAIKSDYRSAVWGRVVTEASKTELLESSFTARVSDDGLFSERNNRHFIYRINQGWIVAHIMQHTPANEEFANGETIMEGIVASFLPRFLAPNKVTSGGKEYFEKYSGLELIPGTSMDLSPLGEAYANFATIGGTIFLFILGLLYSQILSFVLNKSLEIPTLILWIPLLFQQVIKAESDITTGINHLAKAAVVIVLVYWITNNIFKTKL